MLDSLPRDGKVLHSTINDDSIHAMRSLIRLNLSICADGFCPECWSRVLPSTLSTEMTLTSRADTSRHHSHAQPKRGWLKSPPMASAAAYSSGWLLWTPCWLLAFVKPEQSLQLEQPTMAYSSSNIDVSNGNRHANISNNTEGHAAVGYHVGFPQL